jgi:hypothetical protein
MIFLPGGNELAGMIVQDYLGCSFQAFVRLLGHEDRFPTFLDVVETGLRYEVNDMIVMLESDPAIV